MLFLLNKDIFAIKIERIITLLEEAGYDPYAQLQSYVNLGNVTYITRHGNTIKQCFNHFIF